MKLVLSHVALFSAMAFAPVFLEAQTYTYNNITSGTTTQWSAGTGWTAVPVSGSNTILNFGSGSLAAGAVITSNNDIVGSFSLNQLNFTYAGPASGTAPVVTISGNPLNFITNVSTPVMTINSTGTVKPTLTISALVNLQNNLNVNATTNGTISGDISGGGTFTKSGAGTLTVSGTNSYSGLATVSAGFLTATNDSALGSTAAGTAVTSGGTLSLQGSITVTGEALSINGEGSGTNGALRNGLGNNTWTGDVTVGSHATTRVIINSGSLLLSGNVITTTAATQFVLQGGGTGQISGVISGPAGVTKSQTGTSVWSLTGNNTYTGATAISNGTILVNGTHTGGDNYSVGGTSGGTLGGSGSITLVDKNVTLNAQGKLTPGGSTGDTDDLVLTMGTGSLSLTAAVTNPASAALLFDLGAVTDSDKVSLTTGTLAIGTGVLNWDDFAFTAVSGFGNGVYTLFEANTLSGTLGSTLSGSISTYTGTLGISGSNIILTVVPEPSAFLLAGCATAMLVLLGRRRRGGLAV